MKIERVIKAYEENRLTEYIKTVGIKEIREGTRTIKNSSGGCRLTNLLSWQTIMLNNGINIYIDYKDKYMDVEDTNKNIVKRFEIDIKKIRG
ncbi:MAG: hypothetical protein PUK21_01595 [Peptostreptococcaceae bacterium]|nr:hypothetical protein [Peptostreptococcaceae bacterium]MDY5738703.1 hypothetical protein [Anaerovoracaceae bacterium]